MLTRVAVLVSGGGTNLQAIIDAKRAGDLPNAELALVVADRHCAALDRCIEPHIRTVVCRSTELRDVLEQNSIDVVVLAGYLAIVPPDAVAAYAGRMINIHPSLLPDFGGQGMYGLHVHEAVLDAGVAVTGATVHLVTDETDAGPILRQHQVAVHAGDTPEILQRRVMEEAEWKILPEALAELTAIVAREKEE